MTTDYEFTTDWFSPHALLWTAIINKFTPSKILEIGSFEGNSTCWLIEKASVHKELNLYCVDTWQGSVEHEGIDFNAVEERFNNNVKLALTKVTHGVKVYKLKGRSVEQMARLIAANERDFDLIYVDGSHEAAHVFADAAMAFELLRVGGILVFDDYAVSEAPKTVYDHPRIAVDAFMDVYGNKLGKVPFVTDDGRDLEEAIKEGDGNHVLYQLYLKKLSP